MLRTGCNLITIVAENESSRGFLSALHIADVLLAILRTFTVSDAADVVGSALLAMMSACASDDVVSSLSHTSVFGLLCSVLADSMENVTICEWVCRLIILLIGYSPPVDMDVTSLMPSSPMTSRGGDASPPSQLLLPSVLDEPRVGSDSSSPRRTHRSEALFGVSTNQITPSASPVSSRTTVPEGVTRKTYPNISLFVDAGGHTLLLRLLSCHMDNALLVWLACDGLGVICLEDVGATAVVSETQYDSCELLCAILQKYLDSDMTIEITAVKVITNIARHRDFATALGTSGACGLVVPFVKAYCKEHVDSVIVGCSAMAYLCKRNSQNKISLAAAGACAVCSECLHKFIFDPVVLPFVMHAIKCLCSQNKFNTSQISNHGILDFIIENLLNTEVLDADISLVGSTLWCIAHIPPASMKTLSSPAIINFIMLHLQANATSNNSSSLSSSKLTNSYVAMAACDAIYSMCGSISTSRATFASLNTIHTLLSLVRYYEDDENVLHSGLMAIANLVDCSPENRIHVKVVIILKAMQVRCDSVVVVRAALATLLGMTHDNPTFPSELSSINGVKIMLKSIFLHMYCEVVSRRGCKLLAILASHDKVYQKILGELGLCNDCWLWFATIDTAVFCCWCLLTG